MSDHAAQPPSSDPSGVVVHPLPGVFAEQMSESRRIIERIEEHPERGAAMLFDAYSQMVNGLVWRLLGADPDHDDVVQQVFCTVLASLPKLRDPERLAGWVRRITINAVYAELRKREVRRMFALRNPPESQVYVQTQDVESRDLLARARAMMEKLPAKERIVFILHYVEGHTLEEIAELQDYSHATAKRRLSAANKRFRALVQNNPELLERLERRKRRPA